MAVLYGLYLFPLSSKPTTPLFLNPSRPLRPSLSPIMHASLSIQDAVGGAITLVQSSPATWQSGILSNALIFVLGSPILVAGLSLSGVADAFLLGTLTWRAFGPSGFLLVATYFVIVGSHEAIICVLASQIANLGESIIGAVFQEKEGFKWLNDDAVNIINISMGSIIAVLMQQALQVWGS